MKKLTTLLTLLLFMGAAQAQQSGERALWGSINGRSNATANTYAAYNNYILLSWRMLPGDDENTAFDIYRSADGGTEMLLTYSGVKGKTCYQDKTANRQKTNTYRLTPRGQKNVTLATYTMTADQASQGLPYVEIPLKDTKDVCDRDTIWYEANDVSVGDLDGDGKTDYRKDDKHYIEAGPEFFSIVDGLTGRELARADYIARGTSEEWGDNYFKRASSLRVAVGCFDGVLPSVVLGRGVYAKSVLEAWDYRDGQLTRRWHFDSEDGGRGKDGKGNNRYGAQGFHSLSVGDVDGDGFDEVVYGSMTVDHDGQGLYTSEYGHGDALHLGKFDPQREGLQIWSCQEFGKTEAVLRDARDGSTIWASTAADDNDTGRALVADIDPDSPGCEVWWYKSTAHSIDGRDLGYTPTSCNMAIWFGSGLNRQLFNEASVHQQHDNSRIFTISRYDAIRVNGTKANPSWYGDILGDWREEIIMPDSTRTKNLKVFTTWFPTDHKFYWLMTDHVYQMSALNQNVGYNMPTQLGYYLGSDLKSDSEAWANGIDDLVTTSVNHTTLDSEHYYDLQGRAIKNGQWLMVNGQWSMVN